MASVLAQRDLAGRARASTTTSATSSLVGSPESHPVTQNGAVPSTENLNGDAAPLAAEPQKLLLHPTLERPSMTKRLTRMFSTKDAMRSDVSINSQPAGSGVSHPKDTLSATSAIAKSTPAPKASSIENAKIEKLDSPEIPITAPAKDKKPATGTSRYVTLPDVQGGHEHHLKSAKRQEKLSDMFRNVISGKKNTEAYKGDEQLSLMSTWVDQLKHERESLASDKRGGPNASASLVEKYGKCQEIVGRGAFGIVRISHKRVNTGEQLFAVKEFRRRPEENEKKYSKRLTSEFCISSSLRHPNVIHTLDLLQDSKGDYCEVMEFCAGGDLYTLVLAAGKLEVNEADCFFKQMMRGVEYMHEMGVAHRDLKPENLLLTTHGALKITDFGNGECFRMAWEKETHMVTGLCGSAPYIAPEEYVDKEFDARAVDVWATGVIYMAMRSGRHLWRVAKKDDDEFYERYLAGRRDEEGYAPIESLHRVR